MSNKAKLLIWEDLTPAQKQAIKGLSTNSFERFIQIWFNVMQAQVWGSNWHHKYLCHEVEEIIAGRRKDTIFNVTPGSGKTEIFSIHLPAYSMIKLPKVRNLNISFADSLIKRNSKRVREIIASREWQELWPSKFGTNKDSEIKVLNSEQKSWLELISAAAGGMVTGSRGGYMTDGYSGIVMLDDIDKPDNVLSKVKREKTHMLLKNTIRSRRMKDTTPVIAIQQRLHTQDSTWFMMNGGMGIEFDQISIPAMVTEEYGESLPDWLKPHFVKDVLSSEFVEIDGVKHYSFWPAKESIHDLMKLREADSYTFESQYQQNPFALGGNVFKVEWFQYYGSSERCTLPKPDRFEYTFITADTAQKTGELNDYSVICYWGMFKGRVYFIDGVRGKWEAPDLETNFVAFVNQCWNRNKECGSLRRLYVEEAASGTGLIQAAKKKVRIDITAVHRDKDKVSRAMDMAPVMRAGNVVLPDNHQMIPELLAEVSAFTYDGSHKHDDIVDTMIDAVNFEMNMANDAVGRMRRLAGLSK